MFDPFNPDRPPMPEDDGVAHQYMRLVNGKKHYPLWDVNGRTNTSENPVWWQYLPLDERGVLVLDADTAVRVATLHNTNFQGEIETLYLSALDVSTERFLLSNQLFAGYGSIYTADGALRRGAGGNSSSTFANSAFSRGPRGLALRRQFTTGADLIVGFANTLTWQLSGPDTQAANSLIDFSFVQPLLRGAGRDVVMERLTLAERTLLYNVRAFERYRTGFYTTVTVGRQAEPGPTRRGDCSVERVCKVLLALGVDLEPLGTSRTVVERALVAGVRSRRSAVFWVWFKTNCRSETPRKTSLGFETIWLALKTRCASS
jgi:hypothetical protein